MFNWAKLSGITQEKGLCWKPVLHQKTGLWIGISRLLSCEICGALQPSIASFIGSLCLLLYAHLFFFFLLLLLRCNFFPKTHPVVFISLVLLVTLSRCLSVFQPSYCEKPLQTNSPLSLIDSLSLSVSLPFFSAVLLLWAVRYIHFSLQSFTIFPTFFLPFFHPFLFLISYSSALLNPLPSRPNTFVPSELIILRDKTRTATCTNRSPSRARSDPELRTQNGLSPSSSICAFRYSFAILFLFFS